MKELLYLSGPYIVYALFLTSIFFIIRKFIKDIKSDINWTKNQHKKYGKNNFKSKLSEDYIFNEAFIYLAK